MLNSINSLVNFVQIWQKVISLVTMATNVDSKLLTIVFLFLSGTDHSVKVSSNSESVRAGALLEFFGGYRELMLKSKLYFDLLQILPMLGSKTKTGLWAICSNMGFTELHMMIKTGWH